MKRENGCFKTNIGNTSSWQKEENFTAVETELLSRFKLSLRISYP